MKRTWSFIHIIGVLGLSSLLLSEICLAGIQSIGSITPGFQGTQMNWIDKNGMFLVSNNGEFMFGFITTPNDNSLYLLVIAHGDNSKVVWTANRGLPVSNSDNFVFDKTGNVFLQKGSDVVWSTDTKGKGVSSMALQDTGNLVLLADDNSTIWQSFGHPTDTLLSMQEFKEGMKLISEPDQYNLTHVLEIKSGDFVLSAGFQNPQPYWSMQNEDRRIIDKDGNAVASASISANSWRFYDKNKSLLWQFILAEDSSGTNSTWAAVLGSNGFITFSNLDSGSSNNPSPTKIPKDSCSTPEPCGPYTICTDDNKCRCPSALRSRANCKPGIVSPCDGSNGSAELAEGDDGLGYFALGFLSPSSKTDLDGCKSSCLGNCSCLAMFFHNNSGNCFMLDSIGSFESSDTDSGFVSYIKVSSNGGSGSSGGGSSKKHTVVVVVIVITTLLVIFVLFYVGLRYYRRKQKSPESPRGSSEEDNFLENLTGMPVRFSYKELQTATKNFSEKLGHGGFGSVYKGVQPDGTLLAVKKLESIGQGKKEFRAEVSIIGSIHHLHLVRLKGFCAEGTHRLLAYEFMANGSLDKWIFKKNGELLLDWDTRFNIALGTAKGLAYLHEDCDSKIVHCDIKPENVLLDEHFLAKVSDFGLAKLMTREQSHVFTTLRGTRGYLAPEWITNYAISEKSDVYSYGMVLLEIIGGRKNYDPNESSEKSHFPTFAYKMMEEGKLKDLLDSKLKIDENDERFHIAIKVALWCIQEDMSLRPSMTKVAQMLEGLCTVPKPPSSSPMGSRLYSSFFKSMSEGGTSSGPSDCNSDAYLSAVRLSGPR
ncbi:G-type lectin S-receptor-like serine/threonine-protein kinase SD2-5 [Neltuma alba]|uniref:G-type lectin S-receptor-like serine/threonine-protein kinase SD2-5 n=1 Tax=Neltuma alba TaxID=207710 RepID=UPI0010A4D196|nr:G-type lectin S-receptor-like serine/threonine-protein kinase SD2-5 [Prosopis alba]